MTHSEIWHGFLTSLTAAQLPPGATASFTVLRCTISAGWASSAPPKLIDITHLGQNLQGMLPPWRQGADCLSQRSWRARGWFGNLTTSDTREAAGGWALTNRILTLAKTWIRHVRGSAIHIICCKCHHKEISSLLSAFDARTCVPTSWTAVQGSVLTLTPVKTTGLLARKALELWDFTHLHCREPVGISDEGLTPNNVVVYFPRLLVYGEEEKFTSREKIGTGYWGWEGEGKAS